MSDFAPVDWPAAARLADRLVQPGPETDLAEATALVVDLRRSAGAAAGHVARITGMTPADGSDPAVAGVSHVLVVDRSGWARANTELLASLTAGLVARPGAKPPSRAVRLAGAAQAGAVLAVLSGKVLGQFDPFTQGPGPEGSTRGRLLLVAPNVLQVERALGVAPADFRLWVALHEQTHALQFAAAPWLTDHLRARSGQLIGDLARDEGHRDGRSARALAGTIARALRGDDDAPGIEALLRPDERRVFEEVGAVMALLEGHADVAMDAVGRSVVPTVRRIRARFEARRDGAGHRGPVDRVLRRVLGLDLKLAQYRDGAAFVRSVTRTVGQEGLNAVWSAPSMLPGPREITDPRAWVRRVHG
ncbi:zinc-dependent metalloprotease [Pengzhenrongella frigida]|uniref:Coenzyme F420 biosynthesis-associated protein n=1 Tax=Pengzhenrongella frigida TaxID=1259133 RepID=A0A4Q5MWM3_9MICO|nr:zinc-dependent metalloprotease [Cellulomonas sp. HLT2-17]RYV49979.1 hypothetical protein EUA98_15920 [Cellulomonas sp. HLT2-17]